VIAACGLVGFVSRDDAGNWAMIGFTGDGSDVPRSDVYTTVDNANSLMIVLFGWFVLVAGAEAYALTRRPRAACAARLTVAALVSLVCVPVMALPWIAPDIDDPFLRGLLVMPLLVLGTAWWLLLYIKSHRSFNLWLVPLAIAAPVTGLVLQAERLGGTTGPMTGWVAVAGFATAALIANIALGVRLSRTRSNLDVTGR
jgi:hypothetical protein